MRLKFNIPYRVACLLVLALNVRAQLEIKTNEEAQAIFCGNARTVRVTLHNPAEQALDINVHAQLYQASSATTVPLDEPRNWKMVQMAPRQTVLESIVLNFPAVEGETRFLVQWLNDHDKVMGMTDVLVYPTNLLKALQPLAGAKPLGVYDPQNRLKPLLKFPDLEIEDLAETSVSGFSGLLAIIGPYAATDRLPEDLSTRIATLAKSGVAVVWIQPPPLPHHKLAPSFYLVPEGLGAVVVVQPELVSGLADNPRGQLNLVELARLARHPAPLQLPVNP